MCESVSVREIPNFPVVILYSHIEKRLLWNNEAEGLINDFSLSKQFAWTLQREHSMTSFPESPLSFFDKCWLGLDNKSKLWVHQASQGSRKASHTGCDLYQILISLYLVTGWRGCLT